MLCIVYTTGGFNMLKCGMKPLYGYCCHYRERVLQLGLIFAWELCTVAVNHSWENTFVFWLLNTSDSIFFHRVVYISQVKKQHSAGLSHKLYERGARRSPLPVQSRNTDQVWWIHVDQHLGGASGQLEEHPVTHFKSGIWLCLFYLWFVWCPGRKNLTSSLS